MDNRDILNREFSAQNFAEGHPYAAILDRYREIAANYARMENAVAVLSDLRTKASYIYYGRFAQLLGIDSEEPDRRLPTIWEDEIFRLVHPDDLADKHLQELCFFNYVRQQPKRKRSDYYLISTLRMRSGPNTYIPVLHRMYYVLAPKSDTIWLALCLYSPHAVDIPAKCLIIDSTNGHSTELHNQDSSGLLSAREKQVLSFISRGLTSKEIAESLCISVNTVSRHRQEILGKLQVKNSIEACRIAKDLRLI